MGGTSVSQALSGLCLRACLRPGGPASLVSWTTDPVGAQSACLGRTQSERAWPGCSALEACLPPGIPPASQFLATRLSSPLDFVLIAHEKSLVTGGCVCFHM